MDNKRLSKIERLIQKELGEIFLRDAKSLPGLLISVTNVRVSPDLGIARVHLSIFPSDKGTEILESIKHNTKTIRYDLGQQVRTQLRKIPELSFFLDDSLDYLENIDRLLKQ
ncbi:30S ribosome-binding factor RbfA [Porphyromonas loveana]|uniref:Ribosome-binding factor A n=1 Tax=Porphyromonas loveana TaxID=1884669 RepID=A0A2U1FAF1_9PORP|nr:30S ribosome-binding factor RbfA [Porphyromonas loveana]PVZ09146.1 ribosome-binding factor A [Porphyromonas loveana]